MAIKVEIGITVSKRLEKALEGIKTPIDRETAEAVGDAVTEEMLRLIAQGSSPIGGKGKFPRYKNPDKYPGKRKPKSPVNLKLEGDFLDDLTARPVKDRFGYATEITYDGKKSQDKERGHREGANDQPERPTIPAGKGERFAPSITRLYTKLLKERILAVLKGKG